MTNRAFATEWPISRTVNQQVLHLVVGAGIPLYVKNAVDSILRLTGDPVLVVYNFLTETDRCEMENLLGEFLTSSRLNFFLRPNVEDSQQKTGSLYTAYNIALDYAADKYRFLNIVQSDMQMVFWDPGIVTEIEAVILRARQLALGRVLCVETAMHIRGKFRPDQIASSYSIHVDPPLCVNSEQACADVGVFDLAEAERLSFRFEGTEKEISLNLKERGYVMPRLSRQPLVFLPWPAVVRGNRIVGKRFFGRYQGTPLLQVDKRLQAEWSKGILAHQPTFWMEDFVQPRGWSCLWPFWPTDILNGKWFWRRAEVCKSLGVSFFTFAPKDVAPWRLVPNPSHFISAWIRQVPPYARSLFAFAWGFSLLARRKVTELWRDWKR